LLGPGGIAYPLRRMIADLLQPHQEGQHDAFALQALGRVERGGQLLNRILVERRLLATERAERLELSLVREVSDDRLVGLEPPQDVRPYQLAQWTEGASRRLAEAFYEARELLGGPQQSGIDEVEDGPQIANTVFDRRAGQRDAELRAQLLHGPGLLR